jgi:hypothetical protein
MVSSSIGTAKRKRRCFSHPGAHGTKETAALLSEVCLSGQYGIVAEAFFPMQKLCQTEYLDQLSGI